ncbi:MAG: hypothetical protein DHS20C15_30790 [Planctomycetota bacterium]|nr:MAG: hypothetical protein DHS20C15_30790 [Planctomycetota bacterium]
MGALASLAYVLALVTAQVDLRVGPVDQVALVGEHITVELVIEAADDPEFVSAVDALLSWDPNRLELVNSSLADFPPYVFGFLLDPDGINADVGDGEALYTALAPPGASVSLFSDLVVARFEFEVLTSACVGLVPSSGLFGETRVHGVVPGEVITGTLAPHSVVEVPGTWADLGGAAAGTGSLVPQLEGDGVLLECEPYTVTLSDALPSTLGFLVIGFNSLNLPFKGGIIVPDLDIIRMFPVGPTGSKVFTGPWPPGVPGGMTLYMQVWAVDAGAFSGYSASNGLSGTTP